MRFVAVATAQKNSKNTRTVKCSKLIRFLVAYAIIQPKLNSHAQMCDLYNMMLSYRESMHFVVRQYFFVQLRLSLAQYYNCKR